MTFLPQLRIPATYMRGGTSKGVFFRLQDLPEAAQVPGAARDALLMRVIGSPDPYGKHTDGMGGATSSTSKCVIISTASVPDHDVDYLYGQVGIDTDFVDFKALTGGVLAAIGTPKVFSTDFQLLMDVNATAGARSLVLDNGDGTTYQTDVPLTIAARAPVAFNVTTPAEVALGSKPLESQLFSVDVDPNSIVNISVAAPAGGITKSAARRIRLGAGVCGCTLGSCGMAFWLNSRSGAGVGSSRSTGGAAGAPAPR